MDPIAAAQLLSGLLGNLQNRRTRKEPVAELNDESFDLAVEFLSHSVRALHDITLVQAGIESPAFVGAMWSTPATLRGWRDFLADYRELYVAFIRLRATAPDSLVESCAEAAKKLNTATQLVSNLRRRGRPSAHDEFMEALETAREGIVELADLLRDSRPSTHG
jgi:hypothetical protein